MRLPWRPQPCQLEHLPEYPMSADRQARLDRLRASVMAAWEGALMWGSGNELERVYAPMVVGLVDVAKSAEALLASPDDEAVSLRLREALDRYLRELDIAKRDAQRAAGAS